MCCSLIGVNIIETPTSLYELNMGNIKSHLDNLLHSTVRIFCKNSDGTASAGTGFIFGFPAGEGTMYPLLITNRHVLSGTKSIVITLTKMLKHGEPDIGNHNEIEIHNVSDFWCGHPDENVDLAALPLAGMLNAQENESYFFAALGPDYIASNELLNGLSSMEDIIMIGYPNSLWDETNNLPIIRRGITATHPKRKYNGKPEFLIDAACFPGSSGSPVFLANVGSYIDNDGKVKIGSRVALLGVLWGGPTTTSEGRIVNSKIPSHEDAKVTTNTMLNLGFVIHASEILEFSNIFKNIDDNEDSSKHEHSLREGTRNTTPNRNSLCYCNSGLKYKNCHGKIK